MRGSGLLSFLIISFSLVVPALGAAEGLEARPNLLVVTFDTTRADRLECYGYRDAKNPAIHRLAEEGVLFTRAYAPAVQTLPSHASMFTGLYPITLNVVSNGQRVDDELITLAEILHSNGYQTGAIVATAPLMQVFNLNQGFETYDDSFEEAPVTTALKNIFRVLTFHRVTVRTTRSADRVAALATRWLRRAARLDRPFFLWIHFIEPHHPYDFHPDFDSPQKLESDGEVNQYGEKEKNYVNEIEFADHYLGKVLTALDRLRLTASTLTVFAADHGESLGEKGYRGHREEVFESIIRVPLVFRFPGRLPAGERLDTPAQLVDVTPTILRLLDVPYLEDSFQGQDLFSLPPDEPRKLFSVAVKLFTRTPIRIAMIHGDHKYVSADEPGREGLFNVAADSGESNNLLEANGPSTVAMDWIGEIQSWWETHDRLAANDFQMSPDQLKKLESLGYVR